MLLKIEKNMPTYYVFKWHGKSASGMHSMWASFLLCYYKVFYPLLLNVIKIKRCRGQNSYIFFVFRRLPSGLEYKKRLTEVSRCRKCHTASVSPIEVHIAVTAHTAAIQRLIFIALFSLIITVFAFKQCEILQTGFHFTSAYHVWYPIS